MAIDEQVLREQVEKARRRMEHDSSLPVQRRLNFEMSVKNLYQSFADRERVPKIQGLVNKCMTFLEDELSVITGPYEELLSLNEVIEQAVILFVTLNVNQRLSQAESRLGMKHHDRPSPKGQIGNTDGNLPVCNAFRRGQTI